jgi:hypothetical protein
MMIVLFQFVFLFIFSDKIENIFASKSDLSFILRQRWNQSPNFKDNILGMLEHIQ